MSDIIPWDELDREDKEQFAELCDQFVGIQSIDDAEKYYGNKEKLIADAKMVDQ